MSTRVVGTHGYAAPEYIATGNVNKFPLNSISHSQKVVDTNSSDANQIGHLYVKSDVYGFGIVLVEMLTGKRIADIMRLTQQNSILDWLRSNILNRAKMRSNMDARLEGKYPPNLALQVARLAYKCIGVEPKVRPSMKEVVETLEQIEAANEKPADNRRKATHSKAVQLHGQPDGG